MWRKCEVGRGQALSVVSIEVGQCWQSGIVMLLAAMPSLVSRTASVVPKHGKTGPEE